MLLVFLACAALLFCLPLQASAAIVFDGLVNPGEWFDYPAAELFPGYSQCGITSATVRCAVQPGQSQVMFGFFVTAPDIAPDSPIGAVFLLGGREICRWQQVCGAVNSDVNYDIRGLAWFPSASLNGNCSFEIALGCKNEAALYGLRDLSVQLFDPNGNLSRVSSCPVATAEPVTTTKATTTEKTTTTKAPATEKPTTTKAPTTEKPATTAKPATTLPLYTTAPPAYAAAQQATTVRAATQAAAATAAPAFTQQTQQTQPGTSRTETVWYTVVYTEAPGGTETAELPPLWTLDPFPPEESQAQTLPTLAMPAPQEARPASRSTPLLYAAAGLLALLAAALVVFWLRAQKKTEEQAEEPS